MKKVRKSDAEWREQLSPMAYSVAREKATERAFSGNYWDHHEHGIYRCVGCGTPLFASDTKFDSGCGWPSYFRAIDPANVREERDTSHGMIRTEIRVQRLRLTSRPCLPGRTAADRTALLHQLRGADFRAAEQRAGS